MELSSTRCFGNQSNMLKGGVCYSDRWPRGLHQPTPSIISEKCFSTYTVKVPLTSSRIPPFFLSEKTGLFIHAFTSKHLSCSYFIDRKFNNTIPDSLTTAFSWGWCKDATNLGLKRGVSTLDPSMVSSWLISQMWINVLSLWQPYWRSQVCGNKMMLTEVMQLLPT